MPLFSIRPVEPADHPYLFSTWTQGLFAGCPCHRQTPRANFFAKYANPRTKKLLEDPTTRVLVACLPDAPTVILGYIIYTPPHTIHWAHSKEDFKGHGIQRALWEAAKLPKRGAIATSYSRDVKDLFTRLEIVYDPYL